MGTEPTDHPPADQLRTYGDGLLPPEAAAAVEEHLAACEACCRALEGVPTGEFLGRLREAHAPDAGGCRRPAMAAGTVVAGRYKLLQEIGEGGMGRVFMAEQTRPIKRRVAVKVIKAGMDTKQVLARFEAERQALALMDHPNIAKVFDAGTTEGGQPFFVMELVHGVPITQFCDARRLTPRQRLELFVPVCQAVQHAHQKAVIHRDLKPSNVLVALYDGKPVPKVIDFGIAKAAGQKLTDGTLFTAFGQLIGTPEYMSPEQAELNQLDVDTRTDVYSLGVLLYELLTGSTPLERERIKRVALLEVLRMVREVEPPRPSARLSTADALPTLAANRNSEPRSLTGLLRTELDWIVMKALEKDRTRRYETAVGFAADVQRFLAGEPVLAHPPGRGYRLRKLVRRNRGPVLAAALAVLCLVAGVVGTSLGLVEARRKRDEAVDARAAEREERDRTAAALGREKEALAARTAALVSLQEQKQQTDRVLAQERQSAYLHRVNVAYRAWLMNDSVRAAELLADCPPDLRAWEWHYLRRLLHTELVALRGHRRQVTGVAFTADGTRVASASADAVAVWDAGSGAKLLTLPERGRGYENVAFSPDGQWLAIAEWRTVSVCDARTGKEVWSIPAHEYLVSAVAFSPDGRRVASAGGVPLKSGEVKIWDAATGKELLHLPLRTWANCVAFSPDGDFVAAGEGDLALTGPDTPAEIQVWDAATGRKVVALKGPNSWVLGLAFSPDSKLLASACGRDRTVRIWEVPTGRPVHTLRGHTADVRAVAFLPDGTQLVSGGDDRVIRVWDTASGQEGRPVRGHTRPITGLAVPRSGRRVASASGGDHDGGEVRVWDVTADQAADSYTDRLPVSSLAVNRDGTQVASASGQWLAGSDNGHEVLVRELGSGRPVLKITGGRMGFTAVRFAPSGEFVATAGDDGVKLWDPTTGRLLRLFPMTVGQSGAMAVSPDSRRVAAVNGDGGAVELWDRGSDQVFRTFQGHPKTVTGVAFSPDGKHLAIASVRPPRYKADGTGRTEDLPAEVKVWEIETGKAVRTLPGGGLGVAYSPDGATLASGGLGGGLVTVWDTATGRERLTLKGPARTVNCLAFIPDGRRIVTGGMDGSVRLWDAATGQEVITLGGHDAPVSVVESSPDGRYIVSGGSRGAGGLFHGVRVWDAGVPPEPHPNPKAEQ